MPAEHYDNTNRGTLFKNDKGGNEARPDYTGRIDVAGKNYRLAAWIRESQKTGNKFLSISVSELEQPKEESSELDTPVDDSIPF